MNTKERIFENALDLFCEKGVSATSIRDITKSVGLSVGAFYNHFESKDQLLQQIYDHYRELYTEPPNMRQNYEALLDKLGITGIFGYLAQQFIDAMGNEKMLKLSKVIVMEQYTNPTAGEIAHRDRQRLISAMEQIFTLMSQKGLIRVTDPVLTGRLMGYALLGISEQNIYDYMTRGMDPRQIITRQFEMVVNFVREIMTPQP